MVNPGLPGTAAPAISNDAPCGSRNRTVSIGFSRTGFGADLSPSRLPIDADLLGLILASLLGHARPASHLRPFLCVGVLGAWTTTSGFAVETVFLVRHGHGTSAAAYVLAPSYSVSRPARPAPASTVG